MTHWMKMEPPKNSKRGWEFILTWTTSFLLWPWKRPADLCASGLVSQAGGTFRAFHPLVLLWWKSNSVNVWRALFCCGEQPTRCNSVHTAPLKPCFRRWQRWPPAQTCEQFTVTAQSPKSTFPINAALLLPPRCTPPWKCQHQYCDVLCVRLAGPHLVLPAFHWS